MSSTLATRGTTNRNERGNSEDRRRRRQWLVTTYRADRDLLRVQWKDGTVELDSFVITAERMLELHGDLLADARPVPTCRCYRCGALLTVDTVRRLQLRDRRRSRDQGAAMSWPRPLGTPPAADSPPSPRVATPKALAELADDIRQLQVHAIDSPAYRHGANDALAAVLSLIDLHARAAVHGAPCAFPECPRTALHPATTMCGHHANVRVSGSYADDRHPDGGHG